MKNIKVTENLFTYKVPNFLFKIDLNSVVRNNNSSDTSDRMIINLNELNIVHLIDNFISLFCDVQLIGDVKTFTMKQEFAYLELMEPELLPFINFIDKFKKLFSKSTHSRDFLSNVQKFTANLNDWIIKYYQIFDNEIKSKNTKSKKLITFLKRLYLGQKLLFSEFKGFLINFLEIINADKNIIKNYRFLKMLFDYKCKMKFYSFNLIVNFFIYFIVCAGTESENYMKKFGKYNHIVGKENLSDLQMKNASRSIYYIIDFDILKLSIYEYNHLIKILKMPPFNIKEYLEGFIDFESGRFVGFDFYYVKEKEKYGKIINFLQFWKLLFLNLLRYIFNG